MTNDDKKYTGTKHQTTQDKQPTVNFIYNPPPQPKPPMNQNMYNNVLAQYGTPYSYFVPNMLPMPKPVINQIVLNDGITGDRSKVVYINEHLVPNQTANKTAFSYTTLGERQDSYNYIKASIFNNSDGQNINLDKESENSLRNVLKIDVANVNPYNTNKFSNNPYKGLPYGFLLYKSCYPIRGEDNGNITCAKGATTINIRVYRMIERSYYAKTHYASQFLEFNEWREKCFYEYIRENILKKKICPHFPMMYGYFISLKSGMNYDSIGIKNPTVIPSQMKEYYPIESNSNVTNIMMKGGLNKRDFDYFKGLPMRNDTQAPVFDYLKGLPNELVSQQAPVVTAIFSQNKKSEKQQKEEEKNLTEIRLKNGETVKFDPLMYAGKSAVILTESPTESLISLITQKIVQNGNKKIMIRNGIYSEKVWRNLTFQIMVALYVMQINKIYIEDFTLENNVFIKELPEAGEQTTFWKYKINGIEYFLPNVGFLVMIDSNFENLNGTGEKKKLNGKIFDEKLTDDHITKKCMNMLQNAFDPNNFKKNFIEDGGVPPPEEILKLFSLISTDIRENKKKSIEEYILKYMCGYVNNRIGTYVNTTETNNILMNTNILNDVKRGDIVVLPSDGGNNKSNKFVIFLGYDQVKNEYSVLTKPTPESTQFMMKTVTNNNLYQYSLGAPITQQYRANGDKFMDEDLLETYIIYE